MQQPKVVVIGAGSLFFGRQAIWQMVESKHLNGGTIGLVDTNPVTLKRMASLAERAIEHRGVKLALEASTDAREVLNGADFVVLSFADRSVKFRGIDCEIALKYGVRMCSGDTIGPGGIMRTLRELPKIVEYLKLIEELCPDAWVINYINPTAANGIGVKLYAPELKSFALCDGLHMPHVKRRYAIRAGLIDEGEEFDRGFDEKFTFLIAGPNHFTWLLKAEYEGRDVSGDIADSIRRQAATETDGGDIGAKAKYNDAIGAQLYDAFGYVPTCIAHTKEYVRFWQGLGRSPEPIESLSIWEPAERYPRHAEMSDEVDGYAMGVEAMERFFERTGADHATDIIETMWSGLDKSFFINQPNAARRNAERPDAVGSNIKTISNMPDDAFLEILCRPTMDGLQPVPIGEAPIGLRGLWQQVLDAHELSARAAMNCDRDLLYRAFLCDPLVSSLADSAAMIEELLEAERDALPGGWSRD